MARHYSFCLSTQVAIFPLSCTLQRSNNGASFNLTGNASVEFWRCDRLIRETYPRLYTVSFTRCRLSIMRMLQIRASACIPRAYSLWSVGRSELREAPRPVYRCPWQLRFLIRYRMPPFSPTRRRPSLRVLSPRSRPALGLTSLLADTHHVDDSIKISGLPNDI